MSPWPLIYFRSVDGVKAVKVYREHAQEGRYHVITFTAHVLRRQALQRKTERFTEKNPCPEITRLLARLAEEKGVQVQDRILPEVRK